MIESEKPHRLWSVDNKRCFVNPWQLIQSGFLWKTEEKTLQLKTCLYFLPPFEHSLHQGIATLLTSLSREQLTQTWRQQLLDLDTLLVKHQTQNPTVPSSTFRILKLEPFLPYAILLKHEGCLQKLSPLPTHQVLLKHAEPTVDVFYRQQKPDYYQTFKAHYRTNAYQQYFSTSTLNFLQQHKLQTNALCQSLIQLYPDIATTLPWATFSEEGQEQLLHLLRHQPTLTALHLRECRMLTNEALEVLLKTSGANLKTLDLSHCAHLTDAIFSMLSRYCPKLETLVAEGLFKLAKVQWTANLPELTSVSLKDCHHLTSVQIQKAPKLAYVSVLNTLAVVQGAEGYAQAFFNRGLAKNNLGRYEDAIQDYDEALRLNPEYALAFNNRGDAKEKLGRTEDALNDFDEAIRLNPKDANAFTNRGYAKEKLGRTEEALQDYEEALRLKPDYERAQTRRQALLDKISAQSPSSSAPTFFASASSVAPASSSPFSSSSSPNSGFFVTTASMASGETAKKEGNSSNTTPASQEEHTPTL